MSSLLVVVLVLVYLRFLDILNWNYIITMIVVGVVKNIAKYYDISCDVSLIRIYKFNVNQTVEGSQQADKQTSRQAEILY